MIKAYINSDGILEKYEPVTYNEVILDFDITDSLVIDEETKSIVRIQDSIQWKRRIDELLSIKDRAELENIELESLLWNKTQL